MKAPGAAEIFWSPSGQGADGKPWNDESDWEHWLEVIDKADAEDQILTALEVRPSSSIVSFSGTSRS